MKCFALLCIDRMLKRGACLSESERERETYTRSDERVYR